MNDILNKIRTFYFGDAILKIQDLNGRYEI